MKTRDTILEAKRRLPLAQLVARLENIPAELRTFCQWVCWKLEMVDGRLTKIPYTVADIKASATDPQTWASFESCVAALRSNKFNGLGFVFAAGGDFTGIDFDKHRDKVTGELDSFASGHVARANSYTEISQSETGVHVIVRATKGKEMRCKDQTIGFEIYDKGRFFVMTGNHLDGTPRTIEPRQQAVEEMLREIFPAKEKLTVNKPAQTHALTLSDSEIISKASEAKNGAKFSALWRGDFAAAGYASQSEADAALLGLLHFWTGGNKARSFSLFAQSGLNRDKWQREDYRESTWQFVADGETYSPETKSAPSSSHADIASASLEIIVLPSGAVSISESARVIFQRIAPMRTLFWRGGVLVELVEVDGVQGLDVLKPEKFRSDVEKIGQLYAYRAAGKGEPALKPAKMSLDDAKAILAASESREFLPSVASVLRCPVLTESKSGSVAILGRGYHAELGGLLIVDGNTPPQVPLAEAVASLRWLVEEFDFQTEADRSRALAAFLTPALRIGGLLHGNIPIDCAEADKSQSGKGHRLEMVCTLHNEKSYFVTAKAGGVGSVDESFAAALVSARPFICLDNFRGKMNSQNLEAFLTCPSLFPARIPRAPEVLIDPRRFILQMSSNGLETTRDLANRASICRIRKRPGFQYRDTLGELQRRQPYFLGCVFAVIAEWIANGKPRTKDTRHDFSEWNQTLDWIMQKILGCAPLMDGHQAAQERTSNPALSFVRAVALAVAAENRLGDSLIASELVEICELHAIKIPGDPGDEGKAKRQVGSLCKQVFRAGDSVDVDGFTVTRNEEPYRKPSGDMDTTNAYTFTK